MKSLSHVQLFATPWTVAHQAPPSMGFSRQEYWSGLPFPSPGNLLDTGVVNLGLLHCWWILYHLSHQGNLTLCWGGAFGSGRVDPVPLKSCPGDNHLLQKAPGAPECLEPTSLSIPPLAHSSHTWEAPECAGSCQVFGATPILGVRKGDEAQATEEV